jgi:hypothetical protein
MVDQLLGYSDFVRLVIDAVQAAGIEYLIGGALAAQAWGEPRSTMDVDIVVDLPFEAIPALSRELEKRQMLVPAEVILDAILENSIDLPINAIHMFSGFKADIYPLRPQDELRRSALQRRVSVDFGPPLGVVYVHSPEDLIVYKTWYFSLSQQTKHVRDIAAVLKSLGNEIDFAYIDTWVNQLGLNAIWQAIQEQIQHQA